MARPSLTPEQIAEFRTNLINAAMKLFAEQGYENFSLRALAKELGCSHTTPYRYFDGKEDIFHEVRLEGFRRFTTLLKDKQSGIEDPAERLVAIAYAYLEFSRTQQAAFRAMFELGQPLHDPKELPPDSPNIESWMTLRDAVKHAISQGAMVGSAHQIAHIFWSALHGLTTLEQSGRLNLGISADELVEPIVRGIIHANAQPQN